MQWRRGCYYYSSSYNKAWSQILRRFKSCSRVVGGLWWWESLNMVLLGKKTSTACFGHPLRNSDSSSSSSSSYIYQPKPTALSIFLDVLKQFYCSCWFADLPKLPESYFCQWCNTLSKGSMRTIFEKLLLCCIVFVIVLWSEL